jgi:signal transduction histidine kinase
MLTRVTEGQLSDKPRRYLKTIGNASLEMGRLIDDLLSFSRMGRAELCETIVDLDAIVRDCLLNLCINARAAMPEGGTLTLELANLDADAAYCSTIADARPGPYIVVRVSDTGGGIPLKNLDRIFEPFFSTKEAGKGTGLGLAAVMNIVKSHGGFIQVQSKIGEGTTFSVALPATTDADTVPDAAKVPVAFRGCGETVLIVDDEPLVLETMGSSTRIVVPWHRSL